jgi:hypothetical protein
MTTRKPRGLGVKPALVLTSLRLSAETLAYFKRYPSYTHAMRKVLEAHAELCDLVHELPNDTAPLTYDAVQVVGDFLSRHIHNTLVVEGAADKRSYMPLRPTLEPKGGLINRYEPDTGLLFITAKHFKNDCAEQQLNYQDILSKLKRQGIFLGAKVKRMSKGMKIVSSGVQTLVFDCSLPDFTVDVQNLYATAEESAKEEAHVSGNLFED